MPIVCQAHLVVVSFEEDSDLVGARYQDARVEDDGTLVRRRQLLGHDTVGTRRWLEATSLTKLSSAVYGLHG